MEALAPDLLAFDETTAGERLRRYELASGRGLSRSLEDLRKYRSQLSAAGGPVSVVGGAADVEVVADADLPIMHDPENAPNEPTPLPVSDGPFSVAGGEAEVEMAAGEPGGPTRPGKTRRTNPFLAKMLQTKPSPVRFSALHGPPTPSRSKRRSRGSGGGERRRPGN